MREVVVSAVLVGGCLDCARGTPSWPQMRAKQRFGTRLRRWIVRVRLVRRKAAKHRETGMPSGVEPYRVQAYNTAKQSENKKHDDTVAKRFGFSGGLVPGVDVLAYMVHPAVAH